MEQLNISSSIEYKTPCFLFNTYAAMRELKHEIKYKCAEERYMFVSIIVVHVVITPADMQIKTEDFICIILQIIRLINPMHIHEIRPITHGMFNWLFSKYDKMPRENLPLDTPVLGLKN